VKALTKEKKEKENVLTYLELMNMKNAFLIHSKESRDNRGRKREVDGGKVLKEFTMLANIVGDCTRTKEELGLSQCQEKDRRL
jgi:hypothetical protein